MKLDKLNKAILRELNQDSTQSYRQIARKLGTAISTISKRIEKMKKEKTIRRFTTEIDYNALGYDLTAIINIKVEKGKSIEIGMAVKNLPNVCAVYDLTGTFDTMVIAKFRNRRELRDLIHKILSQEFVERTESAIVLTRVKEQMHWFPEL